MTRFLVFGIFSLIFILVGGVFANFDQALNDFRFQFENYTKARQEYLAAKAKYKQFKTLPTETEAFATLKKVLVSRAKTMEVYFSVLQEKLNETEGIGEQKRFELTAEIAGEVGYFQDFEKRVAMGKNLAEAENLTHEFEGKKQSWQNITTKVRGVVFSSSLATIAQTLGQLTEKTEGVLANKNLPDFNLREEKIAIAKTKISQTQNLVQTAQNTFFAIKPSSNPFEAFRLEEDGKKNGESGKNLLKEAQFLVTEAARGF